MTTFLIGCTHFGHANIINLAKRPFSSVEEMDAVLIERWNQAVEPRDTVYHLGDFCWGDPAPYLDKLNGRIVRIQGNHDPKGWGFNYLRIKEHGHRSVLFHYPIEEWDGWWRGTTHFHAHTHKREFLSAERRGNVGADAIDFTPISLGEAVERAMQMEEME